MKSFSSSDWSIISPGEPPRWRARCRSRWRSQSSGSRPWPRSSPPPWSSPRGPSRCRAPASASWCRQSGWWRTCPRSLPSLPGAQWITDCFLWSVSVQVSKVVDGKGRVVVVEGHWGEDTGSTFFKPVFRNLTSKLREKSNKAGLSCTFLDSSFGLTRAFFNQKIPQIHYGYGIPYLHPIARDDMCILTWIIETRPRNSCRHQESCWIVKS